MPSIQIDEFSAKPTGFLAKWRYRRVFVNTTFPHAVTSFCVPGKECLNLPDLSSYQKVSRRYAAGAYMTDFCDFITFERVTVTATNTEPFAQTTAQVNVAACGYNTALPTPAVPPNPWGSVEYGAYKSYDFCDWEENYLYLVTIYKKDFSGALTEINVAAPVPVSFRFSRDNKFDAIVGKEISFEFISDDDFDLSEFQEDDERQYKAIVERTTIATGVTELFLSGFIVPDLADEPFDASPYPVTLTITDGLGLLKNQSYPIPVNGTLNIQQPFIDILAFCFSQTGLTLDIYTYNNMYEQKMANGINDDPMAQAKVNPLRMADDKGNITNCYEALSNIAEIFGAFIVQSNGCWHFVRVNDLCAPVVRRRKYNYTALFLYADQYYPVKTVGLGEEVEMINNNAKRYRGAAYKYVNATLKFGFLPSTVYNGDFEIWDDLNFRYWTSYGGLSFSRIQKTLPGGGGQPVPIEDYCLQFNEAFNSLKWMQPANLSVNIGDSIILMFNMGSFGYVDLFRFRMKVGEYWLQNSDATASATIQQNGTTNINNSGSYVWIKTGLATATFLIGNANKDINTFQVQISIPEMPTFGELEIHVMGFNQYNTAAQSVNNVDTTILVPVPYNPVQIDNFSIALTKNPSENTPDGNLYRSMQNKYYTSSKNLDVVYGDNTGNSIFNNIANRRFEYDPLKNNLHSIFTSDNSYSKLWYEYGSDSTKLTLIAHLARGILKAYQRTLMVIDCDLQGLDLDALTLFNICEIPGKSFMILSGEFDLLTNQVKNCTLVETFQKNVQSQDISIVSTAALKFSNIPQDTTVSGYTDPDDYDRIFYPQFGPEFT